MYSTVQYCAQDVNPSRQEEEDEEKGKDAETNEEEQEEREEEEYSRRRSAGAHTLFTVQYWIVVLYCTVPGTLLVHYFPYMYKSKELPQVRGL